MPTTSVCRLISAFSGSNGLVGSSSATRLRRAHESQDTAFGGEAPSNKPDRLRGDSGDAPWQASTMHTHTLAAAVRPALAGRNLVNAQAEMNFSRSSSGVFRMGTSLLRRRPIPRPKGTHGSGLLLRFPWSGPRCRGIPGRHAADSMPTSGGIRRECQPQEAAG